MCEIYFVILWELRENETYVVPQKGHHAEFLRCSVGRLSTFLDCFWGERRVGVYAPVLLSTVLIPVSGPFLRWARTVDRQSIEETKHIWLPALVVG